MNLLVPILNLIWFALFVAVLSNYSRETELWFGLWTCGMIGFLVGYIHKGNQRDREQATDPWVKERDKLAARQAHEEEWERGHSGRCGRCGAATQTQRTER